MRWRDDDDFDDSDFQGLRTSDRDDGDGDDGDDDTSPCPYCRRLIYADAVRCPHCENYLSTEDAAASPAGHSWWIILGVLVCLVLVAGWIVGL
jgi:hypothetical protein